MITVRPWEDDVRDRVGFDPRSPYVERFWLGVVGPSTTWLMRRMATAFDTSPEGFEMSLSDTARALGLGDRGGRNSAVFRTFNRMVQFELARPIGPGELQVMRRMPPLSRRYLCRLPASTQDAHRRWLADRIGSADEGARRRSRQLALSLLELGEDPEIVERQLLRWRYQPGLASESTRWALDRHRQAALAAADSVSTPAT